MPLNEKSARVFRLELQAARENATKDAEAFDGIIHVIEKLGILCFGKVRDLGKYESVLELVAENSPLASYVPGKWRHVH